MLNAGSPAMHGASGVFTAGGSWSWAGLVAGMAECGYQPWPTDGQPGRKPAVNVTMPMGANHLQESYREQLNAGAVTINMLLVIRK